MNAQVTSREAILAQSRRLVMEKGMAAVDMRSVAAACQVALGSLYNYFPSKAELISATVESVWTDIFHDPLDPPSVGGFAQAIRWFYDSLQQGSVTYPGFFTLHAISFAAVDKPQGRRMMGKYFARIKQCLMAVLAQDNAVRPNAFSPAFPREQLIDLVFTSVVSLVLQQRAGIDVLLEMLRRTLY